MDKGQGNEEPIFSFSIRPYRPADKHAVRVLCCDTGYFGQPIDIIFRDREWFADLNTGYYLRYEPDLCFVAEANKQLIGYVLGCSRPLKYAFLFYTLIAPPLFVKAFVKCFFRIYDSKSRDYIKKLVLKGSRERPKKPSRAAHFHVNIKQGFRRKGVGKALVRTLFKNLLKKGINNVYGELFHVENLRDESFYTSHGALIFDKKPTTIFGPEWGQVYMMSVLIKLNETKDIWKL